MKIIFKLTGLFIFVSHFAPVMAQQNVVAAGGESTGSGGSVSYTYGQVDFINTTGAGGSITQGVQQPYEIYDLSGITAPVLQISLSLFPNPATEYVQLVAEQWDQVSLQYALYDVSGKLLDSQTLVSQQTFIPLSHLASGIYIVHIRHNGSDIQTYKVIKN